VACRTGSVAKTGSKSIIDIQKSKFYHNLPFDPAIGGVRARRIGPFSEHEKTPEKIQVHGGFSVAGFVLSANVQLFLHCALGAGGE
jgi:hypothetical protein